MAGMARSCRMTASVLGSKRSCSADVVLALLAVLGLSLLLVGVEAGSALDFYHTTDQLDEEFTNLATRCAYVNVGVEKSPKATLTYVRIRDSNAQPTHRALFFFGEHARELISPEAGLVFAKQLCGEGSDEATAKAKEVLKTTELLIFTNINPDGRKKVEEGAYCVRSNENGVDLNRNWNDHWQDDKNQPAALATQSFGGKRPFSEMETTLLKNAATEFKPDIFVTVHSGTLGLFMPYAWSGKDPEDSDVSSALHGVLDKVNKQYCRCSAGAAGKEVGYLCPGTCLDWMFDNLGCKFSFGVEIYGGDVGYIMPPKSVLLQLDELKRSTSPASRRSARLQRSQLKHSHFLQDHPPTHEEIASHGWGYESEWRQSPAFVQEGVSLPNPTQGSNEANCLSQFNPVDKDTFDKTVNNWSLAFMDTILASVAASK